jgi:hypothetical protein
MFTPFKKTLKNNPLHKEIPVKKVEIPLKVPKVLF